MAVRAHPVGLPAAAGEIPFAGEAIAAVAPPGRARRWAAPRTRRLRGSREDRVRSPAGSRTARSARSCWRRTMFQPTEASWRAISSIAARYIQGSTWSPPAERGSSMREQPESRACCSSKGSGMRLRALDLVGRGSDFRPKLAGACDRIGAGLDVHAPPPSHASCDPTPRRCQPSLAQGMPCKDDDQPPGIQSITASARVSSVTGTARFRAAAVFRLMTSSNLVGACTGKSAGFAPLRMRST